MGGPISSCILNTNNVGKQTIGEMTNENTMVSLQCDNRKVAQDPCGCLANNKITLCKE